MILIKCGWDDKTKNHEVVDTCRTYELKKYDIRGWTT